MPEKRKMVVLEDSTIGSMALNAEIVKEFPFFGVLAKNLRQGTGRRGCGSCNRTANERAKLLQQVKASIAGLSSERKRVLKDKLNTQSARITYRSSEGKAIQLTF